MKKEVLKVQMMAVAVALALVFIAGNSYASLRPVGNSTTLSELQGVFDGIGSTIDAVNDQTTEDAFLPTGAGNASAAYIATVSWAWEELEFGIYNLLEPSQKVALFYESTSNPGDSVSLKFDEGNDYVVSLDTSDPFLPVVIDSSTYFSDFGFYAIATTPLEGYLYSQDFLNYGEYARMLTYEGKGDLVTIGSVGTYPDNGHWYIAVEAGNYGDRDPTDVNGIEPGDYTDMVVQLESIAPSDVVPEPASVLLMAGTAAGIAFVRRRFLIG
jgi:hypothetical protein